MTSYIVNISITRQSPYMCELQQRENSRWGSERRTLASFHSSLFCFRLSFFFFRYCSHGVSSCWSNFFSINFSVASYNSTQEWMVWVYNVMIVHGIETGHAHGSTKVGPIQRYFETHNCSLSFLFPTWFPFPSPALGAGAFCHPPTPGSWGGGTCQ